MEATEARVVKSNSMHSIIVLYDMQTQFFLNAIDGISDKDAHNRLNTKANHVAWLTGSLVQQRFLLLLLFTVKPTALAR